MLFKMRRKMVDAEIKEENLCEAFQSNVHQSASNGWDFNVVDSKLTLSNDGLESDLLPDWNNFRAGLSINRKDWDGLVISEFFNSCDGLVDEEYLSNFSSEKADDSVSASANFNNHCQSKVAGVVDSLNGSDVMLNLDDEFAIVSPTLSPPESSADFPLDIVNLNAGYKSDTRIDAPDNCDCENDEHINCQQDAHIDLNDSVFDALQLVADEYSTPDSLEGMVDNLVPQFDESSDNMAAPSDSLMSYQADNSDLHNAIEFWSYNFSHDNYLPCCTESDYVSSTATTPSNSNSYAHLDLTNCNRRKLPLRPIDLQMKCENNVVNSLYDSSNSQYSQSSVNECHINASTVGRNSITNQFSKSGCSYPSCLPSRCVPATSRYASDISRVSRQSSWYSRHASFNPVKRRPSILRTGRNLLMVSKSNDSSQPNNTSSITVADSTTQHAPTKSSNKKTLSRKMAMNRQNSRACIVDEQQIIQNTVTMDSCPEISSQPLQPVIKATYSLKDTSNLDHPSNMRAPIERNDEMTDASPSLFSLDCLEDVSNFSFGGFFCRNNEPQIKERKEKVITQDMIDQRPRQAIRKYYSSLKKHLNRQDRKCNSNNSQSNSCKSNLPSSNGKLTHSSVSSSDLSGRSQPQQQSNQHSICSSPLKVVPNVVGYDSETLSTSSIESVNLRNSEYKVIVIDDRDGRQEAVLVPNPPASITQSVNDFYQNSVQPAPVNTNTALINQPRFLTHQPGVRATCIKGRSSRSLLKDIKVITLPDGSVHKAESTSMPSSNLQNKVYSFQCAKSNGANTTLQYTPPASNFKQTVFSSGLPSVLKASKRQAPVKLLAYSADGDTVDINLLSSKRF